LRWANSAAPAFSKSRQGNTRKFLLLESVPLGVVTVIFQIRIEAGYFDRNAARMRYPEFLIFTSKSRRGTGSPSVCSDATWC
jgi:hypothetical protein